jgi:transglutaminase-like putative cysteine protease
MKNKWFCKPGETSSLRLVESLMVTVILTGAALGVAEGVARGSTPDWLRSAASDVLPKYSEETKAVQLLNEQATTVGPNGQVTTRYRRAYRILRPEGRSVGLVSVYFDSETSLTYLRAWCIPPTGKDYEVKEKDAMETALTGDSLYTDARRKVLQIPNSEPGSVVGYEYEQRRRPAVPHDTWWFQQGVPVRQARYELALPASWQYQSFWLNGAPQKPEQTGQNSWTWELRDLPPVEDEPVMPAWETLAGRLGINYYPPQSASREGGQGSWKDIGAWYFHLAAAEREDTPEIRQKVSELTVGQTTTLAKIQALAGFVQSTVRYVAIEIGIGGYQPHPASVTFANRYGDCKDKATLLAAMLQALGIKSWYVLVNSERGVVSPDFPTALDFNHVILAIQIPSDVPPAGLWAREDHPGMGPVLYFDPTDPFVPLGYLPESLQDSYGLLVNDQGGELRRLPLLAASLNRLVRGATLTLKADGSVSGEVTELRWGAPAIELRARLLSVPEADRRRMLENLLGSSSGAFALEGSRVGGLDRIEDTLAIYYHFTATNYAKTVGDLLLFKPRVLGTTEANTLDTSGKERKNPVEFGSATVVSESVEIQLPPGYQVDELPPSTQIDSGLWSYKSEVEGAGNVVKSKRVYEIKGVLVPKTELSQLRAFYSKVSADLRASAVLKHTAVDTAAASPK